MLGGGSALAPLVLQPQGTAQGHGGHRGCLVQAAELLLLRVTWLIMCVTWGLLAVTCPEWVRTGRCRWRWEAGGAGAPLGAASQHLSSTLVLGCAVGSAGCRRRPASSWASESHSSRLKPCSSPGLTISQGATSSECHHITNGAFSQFWLWLIPSSKGET